MLSLHVPGRPTQGHARGLAANVVAVAAGKTVHVFAGQVDAAGRPSLHLHPITPTGTPLAQALRETADRLKAAVRAAL